FIDRKREESMTIYRKPADAAPSTMDAARLHRRQLLSGIAAISAGAAFGLRAPAVLAQARKFDGITIRGACFQHIFHENIRTLLPEFEEATGMKVEIDLQAFPVYN